MRAGPPPLDLLLIPVLACMDLKRNLDMFDYSAMQFLNGAEQSRARGDQSPLLLLGPKTVIKKVAGSRDGILFAGEDRAGGAQGRGHVRLLRGKRRAATRHACAAPRLTRRRLAGSSPASESDPPSRSPGQRQREDCLRHLGRQRHPSPCDPNRPSVGPSLYIKEASSGGVDRRVHGVLS